MSDDGNTKTREDGLWHLDKRVPIALILTLIVQTAGAAWWASAMTQRVATMERQITKDGATDRLARLETRMDIVIDVLGRMERNLSSSRNSTRYYGDPAVPEDSAALLDSLHRRPGIIER